MKTRPRLDSSYVLWAIILICECVYLGVGQPQASHAANAVGFGVDGAEFLLDGAEISHESIEIHVLPLIQRLCGHRDIRM